MSALLPLRPSKSPMNPVNTRDDQRIQANPAGRLQTRRCGTLPGNVRGGARRRTCRSRRRRHFHVHRPALCTGAAGRPRGGSSSSPARADRLHRRARHACAARPHRAALRRALRHRARPGAGIRHDRFVRRVHAVLHCVFRRGRAGGNSLARLSRVSQYPACAVAGAGRNRNFCTGPVGDHAGTPGRCPCAQAAAGPAGRQSEQPQRHHDGAGRLRPARRRGA